MIHRSGVQEESVAVGIFTVDERLTIQEYQAEIEKAKYAHLLALEAEDKWYEEVFKTQKARAAAKEAKKKSLEHVAALETEKLELIELQKLARIEKQVAAEAVVRSIQAKSHAEDHALNAFATSMQAKQELEKAQSDQQKADSLLDQFAKLESDIHAAKKSYAILEARHQVILNENNRLAMQANQVQREVVVVNNSSNTTEYVHHNTIIETRGQNYCPTPRTAARPQIRPQIKPQTLTQIRPQTKPQTKPQIRRQYLRRK